MADKALCSIPECGKHVYARNICRNHYMRQYRTGRLDLKMRPRGALRAFILETLQAPETDQCVVWPATPSSRYPAFGYQGKQYPANRYMCELAHGPAPKTAKYVDAAHLCGNPECLNPKHLKWETRKENIHDKFAHGTMLRGTQIKGAKLTEADIPVIRSGVTGNLRETAELYGVSIAAISLIRLGRNWKHVKR